MNQGNHLELVLAPPREPRRWRRRRRSQEEPKFLQPPFIIVAGKNWTVGDIKTEIGAKTKLSFSSQLLIMNSHQKLLFADYAEVEKLHTWTEPLVLTLFNSPKTNINQKYFYDQPRSLSLVINVLNNGEKDWPRIPVKIESTASVVQLKMKIDEIEGIPPLRQDLAALLMPINQGPLCVPMLDSYRLEDVIPDAIGRYKIFLTEDERSKREPLKVVLMTPNIEESVEATLEMDVDTDTYYTLFGEARRRGLIEPGMKFAMETMVGINFGLTLQQCGVKEKETMQSALEYKDTSD